MGHESENCWLSRRLSPNRGTSVNGASARHRREGRTVLVGKGSWLIRPSGETGTRSLSQLLRYPVQQGGTNHPVIEILDAERSTRASGLASGGLLHWVCFRSRPLCALLLHELQDFATELSGCLLAPIWPGAISGPADVLCRRRAPPITRDSPEAKQLAYAVLVTGKSSRTSVYLQSISSEPSKARFMVKKQRLLHTVFR